MHSSQSKPCFVFFSQEITDYHEELDAHREIVNMIDEQIALHEKTQNEAPPQHRAMWVLNTFSVLFNRVWSCLLKMKRSLEKKNQISQMILLLWLIASSTGSCISGPVVPIKNGRGGGGR